MIDEHHINWVYLQTDRGGQRKCLEIGKAPVVTLVFRMKSLWQYMHTAISMDFGKQIFNLQE